MKIGREKFRVWHTERAEFAMVEKARLVLTDDEITSGGAGDLGGL